MAGKSRSESGEAAKDDTAEGEPPISIWAAAKAEAEARGGPHLLWTLNEDMLIEILQHLDAEVILTKAQLVCKKWGQACREPDLWRVLDLRKEEGETKADDLRFERLCRCLVDRSQGQLIDLRIANHGEDNLLGYITDRSRRLRRLKLLDYDIAEQPLIKALQKLPELEELHLMMMWSFRATDIEAIGNSCPLLKSFTYNKHWEAPDDDPEPYNRAFAVAKTMPNLRHLSLFGDPMKNEGLKAILDGCPHLESLDLRQCSGLNLEGDLGKRLRVGIKVVRLPEDSISDIEWTVGKYESFVDFREQESEEDFGEYESEEDEYESEEDFGEYESEED